MTIRELLTAIVAHQIPAVDPAGVQFVAHKSSFLDADVMVCDGQGVMREVVGQCLKHDPSEAAGFSPYTFVLQTGDEA
jgi:hypothetical protein